VSPSGTARIDAPLLPCSCLKQASDELLAYVPVDRSASTLREFTQVSGFFSRASKLLLQL